MITIYTNNFCGSCKKLILSLKLCNIDIKVINVKELDIEYSILPVVKINNEYILEYLNFEDILNKINFFGYNISISIIYNEILKLIYNDDEDKETQDNNFNTFIKLYELREIRFHYEKGYLLSHHVVSSTNKKFLKYILINYLEELPKYLTKTYIYNNTAFTICQSGKQTLLHVASHSNKENYKIIKKFIIDTHDSIDLFAKDYYENCNDANFIAKINKTIKEKYQVKIDTDKIIRNIFINDELLKKIIETSNKIKKISPNSMHKTGIVFDRDDKNINEFINILNYEYNLGLDDKIYNVYAFIAEYSFDTNNNLDLHKDDAIITINWNLELSEDIDGTKLLIPSKELIIEPKKNQLLIHHGKIEHQVTELIKGSRKNLIIWLK